MTDSDSSSPAGAITARELLVAEDAGWNELHSLMDMLTPEQAERPGYYTEGWSAKDLLAHIGSWLAEAGVILEQISVGTHRPEEIDVDALNRQFLEAMKDMPLDVVKAQAWSARTRMLQAWQSLPELSPEAAYWIRKSGAEHYGQHLPRFREWVAELRTG
jgi:hypothetical protein